MKKLVIVLVILAAIIGVLGYFAPTSFEVEKEITINKPKDAVFTYLKSLKNQNEWSPWAKRDPAIQYTFTGEDGTEGFITAWSGNKEVGKGEQEIIGITEGERIDTELRFQEPMEDTSNAYLITESVSENETKVKWGMFGENPFPFNVICLVFNMQERLGKDFEEGLTALKAQLEK